MFLVTAAQMCEIEQRAIRQLKIPSLLLMENAAAGVVKHAEELKEFKYGNIHHVECNKLDIELALTYDGRHDFWIHLANSGSINFFDIIYATELDRQKDNILNLWYKDKEHQDIVSNKIRTYESEMDFIKNATEFISLVLKENL